MKENDNKDNLYITHQTRCFLKSSRACLLQFLVKINFKVKHNRQKCPLLQNSAHRNEIKIGTIRIQWRHWINHCTKTQLWKYIHLETTESSIKVFLAFWSNWFRVFWKIFFLLLHNRKQFIPDHFTFTYYWNWCLNSV